MGVSGVVVVADHGLPVPLQGGCDSRLVRRLDDQQLLRLHLPGLQLGQGEHGAAAPCGQCGDHGGIRSGGQQEVPLVLGLPQGIQGGGDCGGLGI